MFTLIEFIGLLDKNGKPHGVTLHPGLNVITGRSATGKSSIIEIFDYCMGESQNTIPAGVILDTAEIFCTMLKIGLGRWVLARRSTKYYIIDANSQNIISKNDLTLGLFETGYIGRADFIYKLNSLYGLDVSNMIESEEDKKRKGMVGAPSIRNAMSYILQHQNLIANKLALFYRFDEKEKKEQTIEQFKIFAKYVDDQYYSLSREIDSQKKRVDHLKQIVLREKELEEITLSQIETENGHYSDVTGKSAIDFFSPQAILNNPAEYLEKLKAIDLPDIAITEDNKKYIEHYKSLQCKKNELQAELRDYQIQKAEIESTIKILNEYKSKLLRYKAPQEIQLDYSICPFCHQHTELVENEAKRLTNAIHRVNNELMTVQPLVRPQYQTLSEISTKIKSKLALIQEVDTELNKLHSIVKELRKNNSLRTQAFKIIIRLQGLIENISDIKQKSNEALLDIQETELNQKIAEFKSKYNLSKKMFDAQNTINQYISDYRKYLSFEKRFDDYDLIFSLNNFELNFIKGNDKIKMRAVGSGSNWLNAHLCLFLALGSYFKSIENSIIPSIIFFDQPSQVYFPSKDNNNTFIAEKLKEGYNTNSKNTNNNDDDMAAVTNIFQTLYKYCISHKNAIQIIVTDHADHLTIDGLNNFDSIVAARWREQNHGLVDISIL